MWSKSYTPFIQRVSYDEKFVFIRVTQYNASSAPLNRELWKLETETGVLTQMLTMSNSTITNLLDISNS
jgi:hypothetical protein